MRSGYCWLAPCPCANNTQTCSKRSRNCQLNPSALSEEEVALFLFLCPGPRSRKRLPRRELQPKRPLLSSLEFPFLHAYGAMHSMPCPAVGRAADVKGSLPPEKVGAPSAAVWP
jgi:hypothetical protein